MLCKDRIFQRFRSLYTQKSARSRVVRRSPVFNAEVTKYAWISRMASRNHKLAQNVIVVHIPGLSGQFEHTCNWSRMLASQLQREKFLIFAVLAVYDLFYSFKTLSAHSLFAESYC